MQAERTRLARELHDIVTHGLSVVVLQGNRARLELHDRPDEASEAIRAIESTGREALVEMRRLLGVLRSSPQPDLGSSLEPAPGLAGLTTLLDRLRHSGLDVVATGNPEPPLPTALDLTAYRIVQESLTNALRHARPPAARIEISRVAGSLRLRVTSPMGQHRPPAPDGADAARAGQGLVGLRERVALFGGNCTAGEVGDGSFVVDVSLPVPKLQDGS